MVITNLDSAAAAAHAASATATAAPTAADLPPIRKLKSSLKLSRSSSTETFSTGGSSTPKIVRFAPQLTTVKRFDYRDEPIIISNENSPMGSPLLDYQRDNNEPDFPFTNTLKRNKQNNNNRYHFNLENDLEWETEKYWFNNSALLPDLLKNEKMFNYYNDLNDFHLDDFYQGGKSEDEDDDDDDDDSLDDFNADDFLKPHHRQNSILLHNGSQEDTGNKQGDRDDDHHFIYHNNANTMNSTLNSNSVLLSATSHSFDSINWILKSSNISTFHDTNKKNSLEVSLFNFLQGQNIRLHSLNQDSNNSSKLIGLIYVNNLNFEKFIEIKFSFNHWKDIHYVLSLIHI